MQIYGFRTASITTFTRFRKNVVDQKIAWTYAHRSKR